ncbi:hypothetical protein Tco_0088257 [Tanacetum coccineum]
MMNPNSESDSEREGSKDEGSNFDGEEEEAAPEEQQQAVQVMDTTMDEPLGLGYEVVRRHTLELTELKAQVEFQRGLIYDHAQHLDALPPTLFEGYDRDLRELYTRSMAVWDEIFSQRYRLRRRVDAQRATMSQARSKDHRLIHDLLVQNAAMQRELQELRDCVTTLERERDRRGQ